MRPYLILIFAFITLNAFSQKSDKIDLNWKIDKNETLRYSTIMNVLDTNLIKFNFNRLFEDFSDSSVTTDKTQSLLKKLNESFKNIDLVTELSKKDNGVVDIIMKTRPMEEPKSKKGGKADPKVDEVNTMMHSMNQGIMLRGSVYESGEIHSFWLKSQQKNLIAMLFELPSHPVGIGDSWKLDISLIANDQNFECDSAYKLNKVTLIDIKQNKGEKTAIIKYEIIEFVDGNFNVPTMFAKGGATKTMMKLTHHAVAEFSIDKGRWISYDGIMGLEASGVMIANTKKKISLIDEKKASR